MAAPSYPLTMPTNSGFTQSEFRLIRKVGMTESPFTGAQQVYEFDYALWAGNVSLPPMKREKAREWIAFLMKLHGRRGTFLLGDPDAKTAQGDISGVVTVSGAHSAGDYVLSLDTAQNSETDQFKIGDYIQVGSGAAAKLHLIVENSGTSGVTGIVDVTIEPALKVAYSGGESVSYTDPVGNFRLQDNDVSWSADHVSKFGISFAFIEAL